MNTLANKAMTAKNQRCQPPASAKKLKAAPELYAKVILKNGSTSTRSYRCKACSTATLLHWSATTTTSDNHSQASWHHCKRPRLGIETLLTFTVDVFHTTAA